MSLPVMPFGGRDRGRWGVHPKGANSMAMSGLVSRSSTGRDISALFSVNGVKNKPFQLRQVGISLES